MDSEGMKISKMKNIFIMFLNSIATENIDKVDHFLDDELTEKYRRKIRDNIRNGVCQRYDMLNISNLNIYSESESHINLTATVKYADYKIDKQTGKVVSGDKNNRIVKTAWLTFRKQNIENRISYKCPGCGGALDLNATSICNHCGAPIDERFSEFVLEDISPEL